VDGKVDQADGGALVLEQAEDEERAGGGDEEEDALWGLAGGVDWRAGGSRFGPWFLCV